MKHTRPETILLTFKASRSQGKIVCPLYQILSDVRFNYRGRDGFAIAYIVSKEWYSLRSEKKREGVRFLITVREFGKHPWGTFVTTNDVINITNHHVIRVASMAQWELTR